IPCFAHTIQLIVKDGLHEIKSILPSLEKVSAIAKLSHTNAKFAEKLESIKVSLPRAIVTRWNSQILMVERILVVPTLTLNEILIQLKYKHLCFNSHDLDVLNEFVCLLSLLAKVTTRTQQQNSPSISLIAPSTLAIYSDLKNAKNNIRYTTKLCDALLSSLLSRFGDLLEQLEINLNETGVDFKENERLYDLYKDPIFLFTPFLDGVCKQYSSVRYSATLLYNFGIFCTMTSQREMTMTTRGRPLMVDGGYSYVKDRQTNIKGTGSGRTINVLTVIIVYIHVI
ncbi:unnamed protein product, partial [Didymodactylos carnosus]